MFLLKRDSFYFWTQKPKTFILLILFFQLRRKLLRYLQYNNNNGFCFFCCFFFSQYNLKLSHVKWWTRSSMETDFYKLLWGKYHREHYQSFANYVISFVISLIVMYLFTSQISLRDLNENYFFFFFWGVKLQCTPGLKTFILATDARRDLLFFWNG